MKLYQLALFLLLVLIFAGAQVEANDYECEIHESLCIQTEIAKRFEIDLNQKVGGRLKELGLDFNAPLEVIIFYQGQELKVPRLRSSLVDKGKDGRLAITRYIEIVRSVNRISIEEMGLVKVKVRIIQSDDNFELNLDLRE
ncbi:MAG: hypothetical protein COW00_11850 [Bdellovibrio sp. CG12_big_fil_rev_8_21_14_0_65_39_13]|nr:MAG: hypothetical protein COW78_11960 [Bdellovibrio sp. CG22_combo_CG10-13_8_21_14_all_39_27]PIQ59198.1 MAG: hypothetical protein COW00_11850 [Bdellovibrio sp. CG12_big_fil_rev_8_21_14_0_65_39_13]PIR32704.1 MAG: hypothetical protein COV37_18885 [Bdellovibrio sp. CG11_big_fil_rev_8_21_14_0_20_39_38]